MERQGQIEAWLQAKQTERDELEVQLINVKADIRKLKRDRRLIRQHQREPRREFGQ